MSTTASPAEAPKDGAAPTLSKSAIKKAKKLANAVLPAALTESAPAPSTPPPKSHALKPTAAVFTPSSVAKQQQQQQPQLPTSDGEYPTGGAGSGVVGKRIKVLIKKVQRVTAYKEIESDKLNADQVAALSNLDKVKAALAELEEIKKAIETAELEQSSSLRSKRAEEENKIQERIDAAVAAKKSEAFSSSLSSSSASVPTVLSFVHLHSLVFKSRGLVDAETPECVKNLSGQEAAAIGKTFDSLVVKKETGVAEKLAEGNNEDVLEGVSYAKIAAVIKALSSSSVAPSAPAANGHAATDSSAPVPPSASETTPASVPTSKEEAAPVAKAAPIQFGAPTDSDVPPAAPSPSASGTASPAPWASQSKPAGQAGLSFGSTKEPKKDEADKKDSEGSPTPVTVKGVEDEDDLFAEKEDEDDKEDKEDEDEDEGTKETEEEKAEALDQVKDDAAVSIPSRSRAAPIDWADDSGSFGSLPPIPSFGGTTQMMATSPLPPKPSTPKQPANHWGAPRPQPGHQQSPTSFQHNSSLNQPNKSYTHASNPRPPPQRREGGFHPPPPKTTATTTAPVEDDDGFSTVQKKGSNKSTDKFGGGGWRSAGGDEGAGGFRGGRGRGGRGRGEWRGGEGRGRGGRGAHRGDSSGPRPPASAAAAAPAPAQS